MSKIVDKDIIKDRLKIYGNNFPIIKDLWRTYLIQRFGIDIDIKEDDVAVMMALMKVSRLAQSPQDEDSITDLINYFWIGLNYDEYTKKEI